MSKVYALLVGLRITRHSEGKSHKFQWTVLPLPPTCNIKRGSGQGGHIRLHSQVHLIRATATFRCLQRGFSSPSARMIFLASLSFVWHIFHVYQLKWMRSLIRPAVPPPPPLHTLRHNIYTRMLLLGTRLLLLIGRYKSWFAVMFCLISNMSINLN